MCDNPPPPKKTTNFIRIMLHNRSSIVPQNHSIAFNVNLLLQFTLCRTAHFLMKTKKYTFYIIPFVSAHLYFVGNNLDCRGKR